ncbi:MAK10-like protein [Tanacetum coccineum]
MTIWLEDGLKNQDQSVETASGKLVTPSKSHSDDVWKFVTPSGSAIMVSIDQASNWLERLPVGSISTWEDITTRFLAQFFPPGRTSKLCNDILMFQQHQATGGKLRDKNDEESWALLEDLALYDNESWNDPRAFAKPVKAISMPQDVPSTSDRRLIELENQVQCLMEAHLALNQPVQVN